MQELADQIAVTGIDHVTVTTPEELETEVLDFYGTHLGLDRIPKPPGTRSGGGWFRVGAGELHVSVDEHNPQRASHVAVQVSDLRSAVARLRAGGSHIEQARPIPGRARCFTRDPAGNLVELVEYPSREGGRGA